MKKNKHITLLAGILIFSMLFSGCGKKEEAEEKTYEINVSPVATMGDAEEIEVRHMDGYIVSDLTGEWIDESLDHKRPLCIMINNIIDAMPQSGISQADITYEILVEGGITRYLCVFRDYSKLTKLGPVRSARHYYVQLAEMFDGFYGHVGWSTLAQTMIENSDIPNLNGLTALSTVMYYRDNTRYAPHNVYTDGEKIAAGIEYNGYSTEHDDTYVEDMFKFNYEDTPLDSGLAANKITTAYNSSRQPWFEYHADDGRYYRFQYGDQQIDDQTGEQLSYKNVIVMFVQYTQIDDYGLLDIDWYKGGTGLYATDGEYTSITWKNDGGVIKYYTEDGEQLKMNPGNSFITVFDENIPDQIIIE